MNESAQIVRGEGSAQLEGSGGPDRTGHRDADPARGRGPRRSRLPRRSAGARGGGGRHQQRHHGVRTAPTVSPVLLMFFPCVAWDNPRLGGCRCVVAPRDAQAHSSEGIQSSGLWPIAAPAGARRLPHLPTLIPSEDCPWRTRPLQRPRPCARGPTAHGGQHRPRSGRGDARAAAPGLSRRASPGHGGGPRPLRPGLTHRHLPLRGPVCGPCLPAFRRLGLSPRHADRPAPAPGRGWAARVPSPPGLPLVVAEGQSGLPPLSAGCHGRGIPPNCNARSPSVRVNQEFRPTPAGVPPMWTPSSHVGRPQASRRP